jgi:hypothetical protein
LNDLDVPKKEIQALSRERTPEKMLDLCFEKRNELSVRRRHIDRLDNILGVVQHLLHQGMCSDTDEISVGHFEALPGTLGPIYDFGEDDNLFDAFQYLYERVDEANISLHFPVCGYFETADEFFSDPQRPRRFFSIDPYGKDEQPACMYLYTHLKGNYDEVGDVPERLHDYAEKNELNLCGPVFHTFLHDEVSVRDPKDYLSRFSILLAPKEK